MATKTSKSKRTTKVVKEHGWSSDDAHDWARAQRVTPPAEVVQFLTFRQEFVDGKRSRTSAQRAFVRAFPTECTENFDGICRCRSGAAKRSEVG